MKYLLCLMVTFLLLSQFFTIIIPPPTLAQSTSTKRFTISLDSNHDLVLNNGVQSLVVKDYLSSTRYIAQESGATLLPLAYYPYGDDIQDPPIETATDNGFAEHRRLSSDISTYHAGARFYSPSLGIFVQPDLVEGPHRYGYVRGNPISLADPSGTEACNATRSDCKFMGQDGLGTLGRLMAGVDTVSGGVGGMAAWAGDRLTGSRAGSESLDSAYASLSGGAALMLGAVGMARPDPGDLGRSVKPALIDTDIGKLLSRQKVDSPILQEVWDMNENSPGRVPIGPLRWLGDMVPEYAEKIDSLDGARYGSQVFVDEGLSGVDLVGVIAHELRHIGQSNEGWPVSASGSYQGILGIFTSGSLFTLQREFDAEVHAIRTIHGAAMRNGMRNDDSVRASIKKHADVARSHMRGVQYHFMKFSGGTLHDNERQFFNKYPWTEKYMR